MARQRVDIIRSRTEHLGTVTAPTEKLAIARAAEQFDIAPARRTGIVLVSNYGPPLYASGDIGRTLFFPD
jgi:hypothetical protein